MIAPVVNMESSIENWEIDGSVVNGHCCKPEVWQKRNNLFAYHQSDFTVKNIKLRELWRVFQSVNRFIVFHPIILFELKIL